MEKTYPGVKKKCKCDSCGGTYYIVICHLCGIEKKVLARSRAARNTKYYCSKTCYYKSMKGNKRSTMKRPPPLPVVSASIFLPAGGTST